METAPIARMLRRDSRADIAISNPGTRTLRQGQPVGGWRPASRSCYTIRVMSKAASMQAGPGRGLMSGDGMTSALLVAPAAISIVVLFVIPIGYVLLLSVTDPTVSLDHYRRLFTVPLYAGVLLNTFKTSLIVTIACLLLGYPLAYVMARRNDVVAAVFLIAAGLP